MNNLSWFLYFADVMPHLFMGSGLAVLAVFILGFLIFDSPKLKHHFIVKYKFSVLSLSLVLFFLGGLTPSKETFYMIAASEVGQTVVDTPEAKELLIDIMDIIQLQLNEYKTGETYNE